MGQANARGTFEERKARAISEKRPSAVRAMTRKAKAIDRKYRATKAAVAAVVIAAIIVIELPERAGVWNSL